MISFLSENEESDIKYLSCFCVYDVQNADLCLHKDLYLEKSYRTKCVDRNRLQPLKIKG